MSEFRDYQEFCDYDAQVVSVESQTATVPPSFQDQWGRGRRPTRFVVEFSYEDLAAECGCSVKRLRNLKAEGKFNPRDFASVVKLLRERGGNK